MLANFYLNVASLEVSIPELLTIAYFKTHHSFLFYKYGVDIAVIEFKKDSTIMKFERQSVIDENMSSIHRINLQNLKTSASLLSKGELQSNYVYDVKLNKMLYDFNGNISFSDFTSNFNTVQNKTAFILTIKFSDLNNSPSINFTKQDTDEVLSILSFLNKINGRFILKENPTKYGIETILRNSEYRDLKILQWVHLENHVKSNKIFGNILIENQEALSAVLEDY